MSKNKNFADGSRLTHIKDTGTRGGKRFAHFECQCGNVVECCVSKVVSGHTKSCGCLRKEKTRNIRLKHGGAKTPEWVSWQEAIKRCYNPKVTGYPRYGGRGITVCDRWREFQNFYQDMGPKPSSAYSLDRIDPNGHYCPENCRWATNTAQSRNRRSNRVISFEGKQQTATEWALEVGMRPATLLKRLYDGWSVQEALTTPLRGG